MRVKYQLNDLIVQNIDECTYYYIIKEINQMTWSKIHDFLFEKSEGLESCNECQNFREFLCVVFQRERFKLMPNHHI